MKNGMFKTTHARMYGIIPSTWKVDIAKRQLVSKFEKTPILYKPHMEVHGSFFRFFFV